MSVPGDHEALAVSEKDYVVEIRLNRPELLNRFDAVAERELTAVLRDIAADDGTRAAVLLAEGPVFSAGGDFTLMPEANADPVERPPTLRRAPRWLHVSLHL